MSIGQKGLPSVLTSDKIDGTEKPNPFWEFAHRRALTGVAFGYKTHRFPYGSFPVGAETDDYNRKINPADVAELVTKWYDDAITTRIVDKYKKALEATSYKNLVYDKGHDNSGTTLEAPHDSGHVLVGTTQNNSIYGDMTDPDFAAYDPIFWLHHSFIDYVLNEWWKKHDISDSDFSGQKDLKFTDGSEKFGVFNKDQNNKGPTWKITKELIEDLKNNEGVEYVGTLAKDAIVGRRLESVGAPVEAGINKFKITAKRMDIPGSFTVKVYDSKNAVIEHRDVFNRENPKTCENCNQNPDISFIVHSQELPRVTLIQRGKEVEDARAYAEPIS